MVPRVKLLSASREDLAGAGTSSLIGLATGRGVVAGQDGRTRVRGKLGGLGWGPGELGMVGGWWDDGGSLWMELAWPQGIGD